MGPLKRCLLMTWAAPWSAVGLAIGAAALGSGGGVQRSGPTLEFWGGAARAFLRRLPLPGGASAITFGHVILGRSPADLERCRDHERIHVRQYERWGPFFGPAYLLSSLVAWCRGGDAYFGNHFEREAYDDAP